MNYAKNLNAIKLPPFAAYYIGALPNLSGLFTSPPAYIRKIVKNYLIVSCQSLSFISTLREQTQHMLVICKVFMGLLIGKPRFQMWYDVSMSPFFIDMFISY